MHRKQTQKIARVEYLSVCLAFMPGMVTGLLAYDNRLLILILISLPEFF